MLCIRNILTKVEHCAKNRTVHESVFRVYSANQCYTDCREVKGRQGRYTVGYKDNVGMVGRGESGVVGSVKPSQLLMADGRVGVGAIVKTDGSAGPMPLGETRLELFKALAIRPEPQVINVPKEVVHTLGDTGSKVLDKALDLFSGTTIPSLDGAAPREIITENSDPRSITRFPPENHEVVQQWNEDPPLETTLGFPVIRPPHPHKRIRESMRIKKSSKEDYPWVQDFSWHYDFLIVGGGLVGSFIANWIVDRVPIKSGIKVGIIDRDPTYRYSTSTCSPMGMTMQLGTPEMVEMSLFGADYLRHIGRKMAVDAGLESDEDYFNIPNLKFQPHGQLTLATEDQMEDLLAAHEIQRLSGAQTAMMTKKQLASKFPWLKMEDIAGGCLGLESEGWFDAWNLLQAVKLKNISLGIDYIDGEVIYFKKCSIPGMNKEYVMDQYEDGGDVLLGRNHEAHVLLPDSSQVYPIHFAKGILAGGGETGNLGRLAGIGMGRGELGVEVPVERKRDFVFKINSPSGPGLNCPLTLDPSGLMLKREGHQGDYLVTRLPNLDTEEVPTNMWGDVDPEYWDHTVLPMLQNRVSGFESPTVVGSTLVDYDHNYYDGCPIIGPHPLFHNMYLACGFGGLGAQVAPAVGRAISELLHDDGYTTIDLSRFHFDRVLKGREMREKFRATF